MDRLTLEALAQKAINTKELGDPHLDSLFLEDPLCNYYRFIYYLIQLQNYSLSAELGVCTGRCTAHMAAANLGGKVIAVDPEKHGAFEPNTAPYSNIEFHQVRSDDPELLKQIPDYSLDLCFIDSIHAVDYVLKEVNLWTPKMASGGIFLFDDLNLDDSMRQVLPRLPFDHKGNLEGLHHKGFGYAIV